MASAGETLPALLLGAVATLRVATAEAFEVRLAASAYAPLSYKGDGICIEAPGGGVNCYVANQHASQLGVIQVELVTRRPGAHAGFYGVIGAGAYLANEAIRTNPPPGISSRANAFAASAGIGRRLTFWGVRGHADARLHRLQAVFGEHQWALSLTLALNWKDGCHHAGGTAGP